MGKEDESVRRGKESLFVAVALVTVTLGASASKATPAPKEIEFKVTLKAELSQRRTLTTTHTALEGCQETTTVGDALAISLRTAKPSTVVVRRGTGGRVIFAAPNIRPVTATGGGTGDTQTPSCSQPGLIVIGDCVHLIVSVQRGTTSFARVAPGELVFDQVHPTFPNKGPCGFALPKTVPPLGLPLAKGYLSEKQLLNPKVRVVVARGVYNARLTIALENGSAELVRRVHWRMTFRRVHGR
jgi:hypothetical protein